MMVSAVTTGVVGVRRGLGCRSPPNIGVHVEANHTAISYVGVIIYFVGDCASEEGVLASEVLQ